MKKVCFILLLIFLSHITYSSGLDENLYRIFYSKGFIVSVETFDKTNIPTQIDKKLIDRFELIYTSDYREPRNAAFLVCDTRYNIGDISCDSGSITGPQSDIVFSAKTSSDEEFSVYSYKEDRLTYIIFPLSYFYQIDKRGGILEYLDQLYTLNVQSIPVTPIEVKSSQVFEVISSSEFNLFVIILALVYVTAIILKRSWKHLLATFALFVVNFAVYSYSKGDYFTSYLDYISRALLPNFSLILAQKLEFGLLIANLLVLTLFIQVFLVASNFIITVYKTRPLYLNIQLGSLSQVILILLTLVGSLRLSLAAAVAFLFTLVFHRKHLVRVIFIGVVLGLGVSYFLKSTSRKTSEYFQTRADFVLLPYTIEIPQNVPPKSISPKHNVYLDRYMAFSPEYRVIYSAPLKEFKQGFDYLIYNFNYDDENLELAFSNADVRGAFTSKAPTPFGYFNLDSNASDTELEVSVTCSDSRLTPFNIKPYYYDEEFEGFRRDASRIYLFEDLGCANSQTITTQRISLEKATFRKGLNIVRFNSESSGRVVDVKVYVNGRQAEYNYLVNFYTPGVLVKKYKGGQRLNFYSVDTMTTLQIQNSGEMLDLQPAIAQLQNKGIIKNSVEISSDFYGQALYTK